MGQKSRLKKFARNAINQKDINNAFLGKLPDGLKTRVTDNIKTQDTQMAQMLKDSLNHLMGWILRRSRRHQTGR